VKIAASILAADLTCLGAQIRECQAAGADWIHVDVMDGHFVPNITFGPVVVEAIRRATDLPLDVHLMISEPDRYVADFAQAGADILTVHVETSPHLHRLIQQIKALGKKAGVSLNPATSAACLGEILPEVDLVLVMLVNPGFAGQRMITGVIPKVRQLRRMLDEAQLSAELEVDGGINATTAPLLMAAGAEVFVAAHAIFQTREPIAAAIARLRQSVGALPLPDSAMSRSDLPVSPREC